VTTPQEIAKSLIARELHPQPDAYPHLYALAETGTLTPEIVPELDQYFAAYKSLIWEKTSPMRLKFLLFEDVLYEMRHNLTQAEQPIDDVGSDLDLIESLIPTP